MKAGAACLFGVLVSCWCAQAAHPEPTLAPGAATPAPPALPPVSDAVDILVRADADGDQRLAPAELSAYLNNTWRAQQREISACAAGASCSAAPSTARLTPSDLKPAL